MKARRGIQLSLLLGALAAGALLVGRCLDAQNSQKTYEFHSTDEEQNPLATEYKERIQDGQSYVNNQPLPRRESFENDKGTYLDTDQKRNKCSSGTPYRDPDRCPGCGMG